MTTNNADVLAIETRIDDFDNDTVFLFFFFFIPGYIPYRKDISKGGVSGVVSVCGAVPFYFQRPEQEVQNGRPCEKKCFWLTP